MIQPKKTPGLTGGRALLVPVTGLEPVRCRQRWILSPLRLPIPTHRQVLNYYSALSGLFQEENLHLPGKSFTPRPGGGKRCEVFGAGPEAVKCTAQKRRAFYVRISEKYYR